MPHGTCDGHGCRDRGRGRGRKGVVGAGIGIGPGLGRTEPQRRASIVRTVAIASILSIVRRVSKRLRGSRGGEQRQ